MSSFTSTSADAPAASRSRADVRVFEFHGPGSIAVAQRALPSDGTLLRVETTGVCGTDHHIWAGKIDVPLPQLLGHEVIGRIERLPREHGLVLGSGGYPGHARGGSGARAHGAGSAAGAHAAGGDAGAHAAGGDAGAHAAGGNAGAHAAGGDAGVRAAGRNDGMAGTTPAGAAPRAGGPAAAPATALAEGDRVLIAPGVPCGGCAGCDAGDRCHDRPCYGLTMVSGRLTGGFAPYMELLPGSRVFRVPEEVVAERVVFAEPMACVLSALGKAFGPAYVPPGMPGLVLGFGVIGLCSAVAIDAAGGAATVVEYDPMRRRLAAELGFETAASVEEAGGLAHARGGFPLVVDAAGTPAAFKSGLELLAWAGTLVEIGNFADLGEIAVKPSEICLRDLRVVGSGETFYEDFDPAIALVGSTRVDLTRAITDVHRFDALADPSALFTVRAAGKAMVTFT